MSTAPCLGARERRLLLLASRLELTAEAERDVSELLRGDLDWESILFHAHLHSVGSLLYRHLKQRVERQQLAARVMPGLLRMAHAAEYRNRLFAAENARLLAAFDDAAIPVIVPKGISLLEEIYRSVALRPLIDLIFLVPPERLRDVRTAFSALGYREKPPRSADRLYRWCCPQLLFEMRGAMRIQVLVLWQLVTWPRFHFWTMDGIWRRARPLSLGGRRALVPSPEDLVLYLCLQADNHGYFNRAADGLPPQDLLFALWSNNRIIRFTDIYETVRRHRATLCWERFVESARAAGIEGAALVSLQLTNVLLGATAPDGVLEQLRGAPSYRMRRWFAHTMVPELRRSRVGRIREAIATRLNSLKPYWQLRLSRFIGLVEFAFPGAAALRRRYRVQSGVFVAALAVGHASASVGRALAAFVAVAQGASGEESGP